MPETEHETCSKEWLQSQLRSLDCKELILLDCRGSHEYSESHIRGAVNLCIPSIVLRRLALGKIDLASTIKSPELKQRIQSGYKLCWFILYNGEGVPGQNQEIAGAGSLSMAMDSIISILHRRLKQDGCRVVALQENLRLTTANKPASNGQSTPIRSSFCPTLKSCLPVGSCWHHEFFNHTTRLKCPEKKCGTGGYVPGNDQIRMGIKVDEGVVLQRKVAGGKAAVDELQHIVVIVDDENGDALEVPRTDGGANLDDALAIIRLILLFIIQLFALVGFLVFLVFLPILLLFVCSLLSLCWRRLFFPSLFIAVPLAHIRSRLPFLRTFGTFTWR
ncbi:uncharacterized protein Dyak_GE22524 [Drosophila yakuba]|uniref:Rhodanese domain-containing protein n=1 Tax=Drosophila yakuba TaxID=7245 RepID=A0A0R1E516_DROYA|nr:uncharacterized protein Dyak_GE22524 [Drosophila yakuba]